MDITEYLRVSKICPCPVNVPLSCPYSHSVESGIFAKRLQWSVAYLYASKE
jgi:hypothetical protein